jgi:hypothetical protein
MEFNHETKMAKVREIEQAEKTMSKRIDKLVSHGDLEEEAQRRGCGAGCFPWLRRSGRSRLAQDSGLEVAVFGRSATVSSAVNANARLEKAAEQMENHAEQLYAKAGASRSKAKALMAQGKKAEAMVSLKRAKALEKQAEVAASTHAAIEQQKDMLESSALQREVATALSASIASTKQKTKGLLEKAENAVDGSAELRDAVDDISEVMGGLNTNDQYDEDDLLEELQLMAQEEEEEAPEVASVPSAKAEVEPQAIVVGIDPALYPKAPVAARRSKKREAKQRLLDEDSAAELATVVE